MSSDPLPTPEPGPDPVVPSPLPVAPGVAPGTAYSGSDLTATASGLTPNVAAGLAVLLTLITGLIFLFLEKRNQFVRYWAMQAVFFGAAIFVFAVAAGIVGTILGHIFWLLAFFWWLASSLVHIGFLVVWIVMLAKAFSGKEWDVPIIGPMARQQLLRLPMP